MKMGRNARRSGVFTAAVAAGIGLLGVGVSGVQATSIRDIQVVAPQLSYGGTGGSNVLELYQGLPSTPGSPMAMQGAINVLNGGTTTFGGDFDLTATIAPGATDPTFGGGNFKVTNSAGATFLSGTLTGFSFSSAGNVVTLNFTFNRDALPVTTDFVSSGKITTIVQNWTGFNGFRTGLVQPFNTASGVSLDITPVPTPAAFSGGAALLGGLAIARRRRRHVSM